ncbi:hypothetical protein [Bacillus sp. CRN 9]|uniref:hypothetical protein n=1 Tax=Cytobacillus horneckiae TaxID=549687 RepID=UPI001561DD3D|nr:hypothetical protein [Bacillus sp. CRN 9]
MKRILSLKTIGSTILGQALQDLSNHYKEGNQAEIKSIKHILKEYFHIYTFFSFSQNKYEIYLETESEDLFLEVIKLLLLQVDGDMINKIEHVYWMKKNCIIQDDNDIIWKIDYNMEPESANQSN